MEILTFIYNGQARMVQVDKKTDQYIQGKNLHVGAKTPGATYSLAKMSNVKRQDITAPNNWAKA